MKTKILQSEIVPEVGMGATRFLFSDSYACTVTKVYSLTKIEVQVDSYKMESWPSGYAYDNSFKLNPNGKTFTLIKTTKGWKELGEDIYFLLNKRVTYIDPSF